MANPIILFLDDCPRRTKKFRSKYPCAKTAETAQGIIEKIDQEKTIDCLFLDHDLGGQHYVDSAEKNCGMEVVRHLVKNPHTGITKVIVHSLNRPAGIEMTQKLKDAGYKAVYFPFINLDLKTF